MFYNKQKAFTLLEVIVAISIIGVVVTASLGLMISSMKFYNACVEQKDMAYFLDRAIVGFLYQRWPDSGEKDGYKWKFTRNDIALLGVESYIVEIQNSKGVKMICRL